MNPNPVPARRGEMPPADTIAWALLSLMDGVKEHEIQEITGLPDDQCALIWRIYSAASGASPKPIPVPKGV